MASVWRVSCRLRSRVFANERPTVASIFNVYGDSGECSQKLVAIALEEAAWRLTREKRRVRVCGRKVDCRVCSSTTRTSLGDVRAPFTRCYARVCACAPWTCAARRGVARRGVAWRGVARRGVARCGAVRRGRRTLASRLRRRAVITIELLRSRRFFGAWRVARVDDNSFLTTQGYSRSSSDRAPSNASFLVSDKDNL